MTNIIGLGHEKRRGKDAVASFLREDYGFITYSFTLDGDLHACCMALDPIVNVQVATGSDEPIILRYSEAVNALGYELAKDTYPEIVRILQRMGTEVGRNIIGPPTIWIDRALAKCNDPDALYVFTNVRYPNEADAIRRAGGFIVEVERPGAPTFDEDITNHSSDRALDGYNWDYTIVNDGTLDDLRTKTTEMVRAYAQWSLARSITSANFEEIQ
jgi:hypothetical protein